MNNNQLIIDAYLYFAKFPEFSALAESFNSGRSSLDGYTTFKTQVEELQNGTHSLVPGIKHYVFGVDEKRIKKRVQNFSDFFLMIDFGQVESPRDNHGSYIDEFYIAATVARPFRDEDMDDAEEILLNQQAYSYLMAIVDQIKQDDKNSLTKHLRASADADPFHAPELSNSFGWTMIMRKKGVLER